MKRLTKDVFIERVKEIHNNKYDYSKVEYKNRQRYFINGADKMLKTVDNEQKYYEFYDFGYVVLKLEDKITDLIIDNNIERGHIFTKSTQESSRTSVVG